MGTEAHLKEKPVQCSTVSIGQEKQMKELEVLQNVTGMRNRVGLIGLNAVIYFFNLNIVHLQYFVSFRSTAK